MRKALVLGSLALAVAGSALSAVPASATDTTVTFTVGTTGGLSILPSVAVTGVTVGNTVTGALSSTVTDLRASTAGWTDAISSTNFGLVGASSQTGANLVPAASATIYNATPVVTVPGTATVTNSHADAGSALTLSTSGQTLLTATTTNSNVVTFASTLTIDVTGKNTGLYTGTVTQTVS